MSFHPVLHVANVSTRQSDSYGAEAHAWYAVLLIVSLKKQLWGKERMQRMQLMINNDRLIVNKNQLKFSILKSRKRVKSE